MNIINEYYILYPKIITFNFVAIILVIISEKEKD